MKKLMLILFATVLISSNANAGHLGFAVSFDTFYDNLSPYGEWIELEPSVVVWRPTAVSRHWKPYAMGEWIWTDQGWYWNSYEPFGWATYHYGRWFLDDYYGWVWLPDYEWAPSWVEWRHSDVYIGWAPLPPYAVFKRNHGIRFTISWHSHENHWHFVSYNYFGRPNIHYYIERPEYNYRIMPKTKYRTNYKYRSGRIYNAGIERSTIERRSGRTIQTRTVQYSSKTVDRSRTSSGSGKTVVAYRPANRTKHSEGLKSREGIIKSSRKTSLRTSKIPERSIVKERSVNNNRSSNTEIKNSNRSSVNSSVKNNRVLNSSKRKSVNYSGSANRTKRYTNQNSSSLSSRKSYTKQKSATTNRSKNTNSNKTYKSSSRSQFNTQKSLEQKSSTVRKNSRAKVKSSAYSSARNNQSSGKSYVKRNSASSKKSVKKNVSGRSTKNSSTSKRKVR